MREREKMKLPVYMRILRAIVRRPWRPEFVAAIYFGLLLRLAGKKGKTQ